MQGHFKKGAKTGRGKHYEEEFNGSFKKGTKAAKGFKKGIKGHHSKGHRDKVSTQHNIMTDIVIIVTGKEI